MLSTPAVIDAQQNNVDRLTFLDRAHDTCIQRILANLSCLNINAAQAEKAFRTFATQNINFCPDLTSKAEFESSRYDTHTPLQLFSNSPGSVIASYTNIIVEADSVIAQVSSKLGLCAAIDINTKWILCVVCMYVSQKASQAAMSEILSDIN